MPERHHWEALRAESEASPEDVERAVVRLRTPPRPGRRPPGALLVLAAAGLAVTLAWPRPDPSLALLLSGSGVDIRPSPEVNLHVTGEGALEGTRRDLALRWEAGELVVEVEPDQGVLLTVSTPEARVRVVGTRFVVTRDALGSHVAVQHGRVELTCAGSAAELIAADAASTCLPRTATGLLGRARALQSTGSAQDDVLATVDTALSLAPPGPVHDELVTFRIELLSAAGDPATWDEAAAYLRGGAAHRRVDILRIAASLALARGDCAAASPWLTELGDEGPRLPGAERCR